MVGGVVEVGPRKRVRVVTENLLVSLCGMYDSNDSDSGAADAEENAIVLANNLSKLV
ncbi:hypothetical protein LBMAG48_03620 [Phycisphaerae bacterium]|nr:hypothetical protein LBMAG48_03620 [Phycisphaerae bacterium]